MRIFPVGCFLSACLLAPAVLAQEKKPEMSKYEVQAGDSCSKLAKRFFNDSSRYDLIHKYNELGPTPHKLKPGQVLLIPAQAKDAPPDPDAILSQKKGAVQAQAAPPKKKTSESQPWTDATLNMGLYRAWKVQTKEKGSAELTFRDDSRASLQQNTLVVIYGTSAAAAKKEGGERVSAEIEQGTVRTSRAALLGKPIPLAVVTPSAETDLGAGSATIAVDTSGTTRVMNKSGDSSQVYGRGKRKTSKPVGVDAGMGSKVEPKKAPSAPKPLPPAPAWSSSSPLAFASLGGSVGTLRGSWLPVSEAASYEVEISNNAQFSPLLDGLRVPASVSSFELKDLPVGAYFVRVTTHDADQFESVPSLALPLSLVPLDIPGATFSNGGASVLPGASLSAPAGYLCSLDGGPTQTQVVITRSGSLLCRNESGTQMEPVRVQVQQVTFAASAPGQSDLPPLIKGQSLTLELQASADLDAPLLVKAPAGLTASAPQKIAPGRWQVQVSTDAQTSNEAALELRLAKSQEGDPALATFSLSLVEPPAAEIPAPTPDKPQGPQREQLGAFFAGGALGNLSLVGAGIRVTKRPAPRFSYGAEGAGLTNPNGQNATLFSLAGYGQFSFTQGSARPFVLADIGAAQFFGVEENAVALTAGAGLGLEYQLNSSLGLRLDARYHATFRRSSIASIPQGMLGVFYQF